MRTAGRYAERLLTHRATFNALALLRHYFYQQLEHLLPYYRVNLRSGDLLARLQQDIDNLDNFYLRVLLPMVVAVVSVPIVYFSLACFSSSVAWLLLAALLVVALVLPAISYFLSFKKSKYKIHLESQLTEELVNGIGAIKTLLVYQVSIRYQRSIAKLTEQYYGAGYRLVKINAGLTAITFLLIHLSAFACLLILSTELSAGEIDSKSLVGIILLILVSFETVSNMPLAMQLLPQSLASAKRLFAIIDKEKPVDMGIETVKYGDINFENFTFSYPEQKITSLIDINLTIKAGEKIAIIGASGAGKSTLVNLLMGFWPTSLALGLDSSAGSNNVKNSNLHQGRITISGTDLSLLKGECLRDDLALMSQQGHLFDATIGDNLRLAKHDATLKQMYHVCELVNLTEFIDSLPAGFDTWLGSTGIGLSGGQAKRLQIAQLLLRPAKMLILDEPTTGLDRRNEKIVMGNVLARVEQQKQSLIIITHKPLMLDKMDNIILMEQGKITDQGSHQQLLKDNAYYKKTLNYF